MMSLFANFLIKEMKPFDFFCVYYPVDNKH